MTSAVTIFHGWRLDTTDADEPRARDVDIAERAGLAQPRDVRRIIDKAWDELVSYGEIRVCAHSAQTSGGRPGHEYWLTEAQAVALVSMMRTSQAKSLRVEMVKLFVAYRRGQLAQQPAPFQLDVAHGPRVGDITTTKRELADACTVAARATRQTLSRIHGQLRKAFGIPGVYHLSAMLLPTAKAMLTEIATGRLVLAPIKKTSGAKVLRLAPSQSGILPQLGIAETS